MKSCHPRLSSPLSASSPQSIRTRQRGRWPSASSDRQTTTAPGVNGPGSNAESGMQTVPGGNGSSGKSGSSDHMSTQEGETRPTAPGKRRRVRHGLVIVNTGEGKGKTTAALGVIFRAWGPGLPHTHVPVHQAHRRSIRRASNGPEAGHTHRGPGRWLHVAFQGYGQDRGPRRPAVGPLQRGGP